MADRYQMSDNIASEVVEGETVLLDLKSGEYFSLNPTATAVFEALRDEGTLDAAITALTATFSLGPDDDAAYDAAELADELVAKGLLKRMS